MPRLNQLLCALVVYLRHHVPAAVVDLRLRVRLRRVLQLHVLRRSVAPAATARELRGGNLRPWVKGATVALAVERGLTLRGKLCDDLHELPSAIPDGRGGKVPAESVRSVEAVDTFHVAEAEAHLAKRANAWPNHGGNIEDGVRRLGENADKTTV